MGGKFLQAPLAAVMMSECGQGKEFHETLWGAYLFLRDGTYSGDTVS
ncbi:MAG: hypothetical protein BWX80_01806 [Candidatus Hydrogenedentes bacterium ADurb.Bin101]|nr:MAG: hypothetical protein BWX80_01806 [Candidatus Hydrogenedentes bacterium ADurb.Bin101]